MEATPPASATAAARSSSPTTAPAATRSGRRRHRQGRPGPRPAPARPATWSRRQVNNGGGAMPSFKGKLSDEQIKQIADYVSANAGKS